MQDRLGDKVRLQHILDAIGEIEDYTKDVELEAFKSNSMMFNASIRQLEIVGEARFFIFKTLIIKPLITR